MFPPQTTFGAASARRPRIWNQTRIQQRFSRPDPHERSQSDQAAIGTWMQALYECGQFSCDTIDRWDAVIQTRRLSLRGGLRLLRVARSIADLRASETVEVADLASALCFRVLISSNPETGHRMCRSPQRPCRHIPIGCGPMAGGLVFSSLGLPMAWDRVSTTGTNYQLATHGFSLVSLNSVSGRRRRQQANTELSACRCGISDGDGVLSLRCTSRSGSRGDADARSAKIPAFET